MIQEKLSQQSKTKTNICKICFKEIKEATFHNLLCKNVSICHNCLCEMHPSLIEFKIDKIKCISIYFYNEKVQELLYQYKGCNDYELKTIFLEYFSFYLRQKFRGYVMVPGPSSKEAYERRGFHHVEDMFECLKLPVKSCIHKTSDFEQHNLTSKERNNVKNLLQIDDVDFSGKKLLIIDDVFTTGSTVKGMIELLKTKNPKKIAVLVMAKTIDLDKRENLRLPV